MSDEREDDLPNLWFPAVTIDVPVKNGRPVTHLVFSEAERQVLADAVLRYYDGTPPDAEVCRTIASHCAELRLLADALYRTLEDRTRTLGWDEEIGLMFLKPGAESMHVTQVETETPA